MAQKVITVGNSLAVTIPKEIATNLGLKSGSRVEVQVDESKETITFRPVDTLSQEDRAVAKLTADFMRRYDKDLRNLAER